jgi:hypothetical protein
VLSLLTAAAVILALVLTPPTAGAQELVAGSLKADNFQGKVSKLGSEQDGAIDYMSGTFFAPTFDLDKVTVTLNCLLNDGVLRFGGPCPEYAFHGTELVSVGRGHHTSGICQVDDVRLPCALQTDNGSDANAGLYTATLIGDAGEPRGTLRMTISRAATTDPKISKYTFQLKGSRLDIAPLPQKCAGKATCDFTTDFSIKRNSDGWPGWLAWPLARVTIPATWRVDGSGLRTP